MVYLKWGFGALLLAIATLVVIEDSAKKEARRKHSPLTVEQVATNACADRLLSKHLGESIQFLERQAEARTSAGGNEIAVIQAYQRVTELHCMRYVECYTPPELLRGVMYEDCLKAPA